MKSFHWIFAASLLGGMPGFAQVYSIVPIGSIYKYLDDGSDQGTHWQLPVFDDSSWASGQAPLGYGLGGLNTTISFGTNAADKHITTYFRHVFTLSPTNPLPTNLVVRLRRDDAGVVYVNGVEVFRSNMPTGEVSHLTLASSEATGVG